jgi:hypothetical protein
MEIYMTHAKRASNALALKDKNEAFFKQRHPDIYNIIHGHSFKRYTLNIDKETGTIDIFDGKESIYAGDMDQYINDELTNYEKKFSHNMQVTTVCPPNAEAYEFVRFYSNRVKSFLKRWPIETHRYKKGTYPIPDFYPLMFFTGCWSGLHIKSFILKNNVHTAIIIEPNIERFCLSLYIVDWQALFQHQQKKGNDLQIILANQEFSHINDISGTAWNTLITHCPSFPLMSLFYNHLASEEFSPIIDRIRTDMHYYLNQWGYYDDEINQVNNAFHNIALKVPPLTFKHTSNTTTPVFIIAGGPSLDTRIEDIIKYKDDAIIISCGSAIHPLLTHAIIPDIHVEIESHMLTYESLARINNKSFFEKTLLVGALQLPPNVFQLFSNTAYFAKDSTPLASLFSSPSEIVSQATPTCTNTGLAVATHLRFENIFLFGTDFGFSDIKKHHSKNSIYFSDDNSKMMDYEVEKSLRNTIKVPSVTGEEFYTISMYATSQKSIENCIGIRQKSYNFSVKNCADGAIINGTQHITRDEFHKVFKNLHTFDENKPVKNDLKPHIFDKDNFIGEPYSIRDLRGKIDYLGNSLTAMTRELGIFLQLLDPNDIESVFRVCHQINNQMIKVIEPKFGFLFFMIRGSIWHLLHAGTSVALSIEDDKKRCAFINDWRETFLDLLTGIPKHYKEITKTKYPDMSDPWIQQDIAGNEKYFRE